MKPKDLRWVFPALTALGFLAAAANPNGSLLVAAITVVGILGSIAVFAES